MDQQLRLNIEGVDTLVLEDTQDKDKLRNAKLSEKIEFSKKAFLLAKQMSQEYYQKPLIITYSGGEG